MIAELGQFALILAGCVADLAPPSGVLDLADITRFVDAFAGGCP